VGEEGRGGEGSGGAGNDSVLAVWSNRRSRSSPTPPVTFSRPGVS